MAAILKAGIDASGAKLGAAEFEQSIGRMKHAARSGVAEAKGLNDSFDNLVKSTFNWKNALGALGVGATLFAVGKEVVEFEEHLAAIGRAGGIAAGDMEELEQTLFDVGAATRIGPERLAAAVDKIIEQTGDVKLASQSIAAIGIAAAASGAELDAVGATVAQLGQKFQVSGDQMTKMFDILLVQGKAGAFTLKDLASVGERVFSAAASWGMRGEEGVRGMGAILQVIRQGTASAEMAATAFERLTADLIKNQDKIKEWTGVVVLDAAGGPRDMVAVLKEITEQLNKMPNSQAAMQSIFGEESIRGVKALMTSFQNNGDSFAELDKFVKAGGDLTQILADAEERSREASSAWQTMKTALLEAGDAFMPVINALASVVGFLPKMVYGLEWVFGDLVAFAGSMLKLGGIIPVVGDSIKQFAEDLTGWGGEVENNAIKKINRLDNGMQELAAKERAAAKATETMATSMAKAANETDALSKKAVKTREAFERLAEDGYGKLKQKADEYKSAGSDAIDVNKWLYGELAKLAQKEANLEIAEIEKVVDARRKAAQDELAISAGMYDKLFKVKPTKYADPAAKANLAHIAANKSMQDMWKLADAEQKQELALGEATEAAKKYFPTLEEGSYAASLKIEELSQTFTNLANTWAEKENAWKIEVQDLATPVLDAIEQRLQEITSTEWTITVNVEGAGAGMAGATTAAPSTPPPAPKAAGDAFVPYDGFPATLHFGERVLTREQNKEYSGEGGKSFSAGRTAEQIAVSIQVTGVQDAATLDWNSIVKTKIAPAIKKLRAAEGGRA